MKKVLILALALCLFSGCTSDRATIPDSSKSETESIGNDSSEDSSQIEDSHENVVENQIDDSETKTPIEWEYSISSQQIEVDYASITETQTLIREIKDKFLFYPTDLCIDWEAMTIRWVADCGIGIDYDLFTDEDQAGFVKLDRSIYKGELTEVAENIYSSKGEFLPTMLTKNTPLSDDIDFYIIIDDRKAYLILEPISLEDLIVYTSDSYYYSHIKDEE